jgi:TolB-like protein/tetratricopeptide (TPR) repeat protein
LEPNEIFAFGTFELDLRTGELRKRGVKLKLQPQPIALLSLLVRHAGCLVAQEDLRRALWADDTFVDFEKGLGMAIWKLRAALGDTADNPRFIETLPRKGYRFIAPVQRIGNTTAGSARTMIAVLPFEDLGNTKADPYLVDGLTEELITQLGRLNPQRLGVIARASAIRYRAPRISIRAIAEELRVRYVLTGSIRCTSKRLRITAHLVDTSDHANVWAQSYDRLVEDVVAVQIDLAQEIAGALSIELMPDGQALVERTRTRSVEGYEYYLQGRYHWNQRTPESTKRALEYFQKSIAADPTYALSFAGLADCYAVLGFYGDFAPGQAFGRAKEYAAHAIRLDPELAEPHSSLAFCLLQYDWDWPAAERQHLEAIRLNPNCAPAYHWYGLTLTQVGLFTDARLALEQALRLDPFSVAIRAHVGRLSYFSGDYDAAMKHLREAMALDPGYVPSRYFLGMTLVHDGDNTAALALFEELVAVQEQPILLSGLAYVQGRSRQRTAARATIERLKSLESRTRVPPYFVALAYAGLGDSREAMRWLDEALREKFGWMLYIKMEPAFDSVRADPEYRQDFLRLSDRTQSLNASPAEGPVS